MSRNIYLYFKVSVCLKGTADAPRRTPDFTVTHLKGSLFLSFPPHRTSAVASVSFAPSLFYFLGAF
jgi:hypothetical protein